MKNFSIKNFFKSWFKYLYFYLKNIIKIEKGDYLKNRNAGKTSFTYLTNFLSTHFKKFGIDYEFGVDYEQLLYEGKLDHHFENTDDDDKK